MKSKRPTSERRAAASRANGAKSRGPVTECGKYNSSLNSRRHGILARFLVMPGELPGLFQEQYDDFMDEHQPRTPTERALVEEMVTSWWRKQRVWGMESARITHQIKLSSAMNYAVPTNDPATRTALAVGDLADSGRALDLFLRYETRYERQFHRALARLLDLKSRDPEPDSATEPPAVLPSRDGNGAVDCTTVPRHDPIVADAPVDPKITQIATPTSEATENRRPDTSDPDGTHAHVHRCPVLLAGKRQRVCFASGCALTARMSAPRDRRWPPRSLALRSQ